MFLTGRDEFLSYFSTTTNEVVIHIVGDFNIHLDNAVYRHTQAIARTLHSFGLEQHVHQSTHCYGHNLGVLISIRIRAVSSTIISSCEMNDIVLRDNSGNLINGHYAVTCEMQIYRKPWKSWNLYHTEN